MTLPERPPQSRTSFRLPYPKGVMRLLMRLPILLYRLRLGWILGKRFLLLEHRGRRSGAWKQAVIEMVDYDSQDGSCVVAAAWGARSDWYKNILKTPEVYVMVSTHRFPATAGQIPVQEAVRHLQTYSARNPTAFRLIGSWLIDQGGREPDEIVQAFAEAVPLVRFSPRSTNRLE